MNEKFEELLDNPWAIPVAVGIASFASGLGLGFFVGKNRSIQNETEDLDFDTIVISEFPKSNAEVAEELGVSESTHRELPEEETTQAPLVESKVVIESQDAITLGIVTTDDLAKLRPHASTDEEIKADEDNAETLVSHEQSEIEWDWEEELEKRTETAPYILREDEYWANELNFSQVSLTYFSLDDVLADIDDAPVYGYESLTGPLLFGHGSKNPDMVYVRNHERKVEYEISRLEALYAVEVLGHELATQAESQELKHSKVLKFRTD